MTATPGKSQRSRALREVSSVDFPDLVLMLAEGIADAQLGLDLASADLVEELASRKVTIVPEVREVIDPDGSVSYEQADPHEVTLLELGIMPTFYQFANSTIEVAMDIDIVEEEQESRAGKRRLGLRASTSGLQRERKLKRDVTVHSKLTATLVPVPTPVRLEPSRATAAGGES